MRWAKLCTGASFNLAGSDAQRFPLRDLPVSIDDLEITGPGLYGYPRLRECIARKTGAPEKSVVLSVGTSMANFIALGALIRPGDHILVERPTYQPLLHIAQWLGGRVDRFDRLSSNEWQIDLDQLKEKVGAGTKAIVLSNLHNPSSSLVSQETLRAIGTIAADVGAFVFVDEVYLETLFDHAPGSAFFLGKNFIATSSLTKAYGLSGVRCGWILAPPEITSKMEDMIDLTYVVLAHSAERLSVIALEHLSSIAQRAQRLLATNRRLLNAFLEAHQSSLDCRPNEYGTCALPRLRSGDATVFCEKLRQEFDTGVVPGHFFEAPQHFRIGIGAATEIVRGGLERIATALHKFGEPG